MRHYYIDWLRIIAIGLLLVYHVAIGFQPWGMLIGFITNEDPWPTLWLPMTALNIWRIPLLFVVSGMGVYFAMQHRNWKALIKERMLRIGLPFAFGIVAIVPLHILVWRYYYQVELSYTADPGHLWFLGNILLYLVLLAPLFYYLNRSLKAQHFTKKVLSHPLGLLLVAVVFIAEAIIIRPVPYELYAMTRHGFFLGLLAFFTGFCFVLSGKPFWQMIQNWRWLFAVLAIAGFAFRQFYFGMATPVYLMTAESQAWILAVLAFGSKHLNQPGRLLTYLSPAAYPVYILHMVFLYLGSLLVFQTTWPVALKFAAVLVFTVGCCLLAYEVIRRIQWLKPLFGVKLMQKPNELVIEKGEYPF
jgi:peptidoglycan/LPS O-acetylase OafA/YrhL